MIRRRFRTLTLWTGTLLSLLIAAAFVVSAWWSIAIQISSSRGPALNLQEGSVMYVRDPIRMVPVSAVRHGYSLSRWNRWGIWGAQFMPSGLPVIEFPLYTVFAAVTVPTLLVWRFWPKPVKPGHCECGYDLTGLPEPRCPECGQPFAA